jgi:5,10-methenyltetrahydrofolate synthetase
LTPEPSVRPSDPKRALRRELLARRNAFAASALAADATAALAAHLRRALQDLEPHTLGLYWAMRCEFNAPQSLLVDGRVTAATGGALWALPYAQRSPVQMHYRQWDGQFPRVADECSIPSSDGARVVPDVVLVPCVGYTRAGYRLGYGGGYFDRWLAAHPGVTSVGVAWSHAEIAADLFEARPHDRLLDMVVTERGVA